jgi:hypothetical protein
VLESADADAVADAVALEEGTGAAPLAAVATVVALGSAEGRVVAVSRGAAVAGRALWGSASRAVTVGVDGATSGTNGDPTGAARK